MIDFVAVLIGYTLSGEPTLKKFYQRLLPFALPFMALFGREKLPDRSVLSRFLKAIDQPTVEALRFLFQEDLLSRPLTEVGEHQAGLRDRCGEFWKVFDSDGTRQAARQRALPRTPERPQGYRRFDTVCAPGYMGRESSVKWFGLVRPFCWLIRTSGSRHSEMQVMEITGESYCV